jgi:hypothetical protein
MWQTAMVSWRVLGTASLAAGLVAAVVFGGGGTAPGRADEASWRLGEPVRYENLAVFPVLSRDAADTRGFVTLDEALQSGEVVVTESGGDVIQRSRDGRPVAIPESGGPLVNQLVLINRGKRPVILLAGELVSGGKQDRIIAKDRIVPPGARPLPLDVFCVEHGRWSSGSKFEASNLMVHPSVREQAALGQQQSKVWDAVRSGTTSQAVTVTGSGPVVTPPPAISASGIAGAIRSAAPTEAYAKLYSSAATGVPVESFADEVKKGFDRETSGLKDEHVVGVVVAYGGEVAWSDVFASPALFERYWPKLLRSYVIEALARPHTKEAATREDARDFLHALQGRETSESEPDVYRWREVNEGRYVEIRLDALRPAEITLHWLKIHRTS